MDLVLLSQHSNFQFTKKATLNLVLQVTLELRAAVLTYSMKSFISFLVTSFFVPLKYLPLVTTFKLKRFCTPFYQDWAWLETLFAWFFSSFSAFPSLLFLSFPLKKDLGNTCSLDLLVKLATPYCIRARSTYEFCAVFTVYLALCQLNPKFESVA